MKKIFGKLYDWWYAKESIESMVENIKEQENRQGVILYENGPLLREMESRFCLEDKELGDVTGAHGDFTKLDTLNSEESLLFGRLFLDIIRLEELIDFNNIGNCRIFIGFSFLSIGIYIPQNPNGISGVTLKIRDIGESIKRDNIEVYVSYLAQLYVFLENEKERLKKEKTKKLREQSEKVLAKYMCQSDSE